MAYYDVSLLAADQDFANRVAACGQTENKVPPDTNPSGWAADHIWELAATPSFGDKYAYALEMGVSNPGRVESVISDADILAAVQAMP